MIKHTLTTIFLLILCTYASAQNRSARETLEGLQDFGVVVKYGQVDGLEPEMRPTILQMLQDRAQARLKEAEIPLVQTTDADTAGRPRLVFIVTANKPTDTAPTIVVESKLFERVRLWRDPAKEMELATWVWSGVGVASRVTSEMLFRVLDAQLDGFIKAYREMNPNRTPTESRPVNLPAQLGDNPNALEGLSGVTVFVWVRREQFADADQRAELQKKLQKEAEAKLAQAGISLLKWADETERAGHPLLYVAVKLSPPNFHAPAIGVESAFWQQVRHVRDPQKKTHAVTWESRASDGGPITDDAARRVMNSQLDEFIKAYNAANPTVSKAQ